MTKDCNYSKYMNERDYCSRAERVCPHNATCRYYNTESRTVVLERSTSHTLEHEAKKTDAFESTTERKFCKFCFNARMIEDDNEEYSEHTLTEENDYSAQDVGHCYHNDRRMLITVGNGKPLKIQSEEWDDTIERWFTTGVYYPKFCPECGRYLDEYKRR